MELLRELENHEEVTHREKDQKTENLHFLKSQIILLDNLEISLTEMMIM